MLGDIALRPDHAGGAAVRVEQRLAPDQGPDPVAVLVEHPVFAVKNIRRAVQVGEERGIDQRLIVGVDARQPLFAPVGQGLGREAQNVFPAR